MHLCLFGFLSTCLPCPTPPPKKTIEHVYHALIKRKRKNFKTPLPWLWFQKIGKISPIYTFFVSPKNLQAFYFQVVKIHQKHFFFP
jgi:hypothetical protein